MTYGAAHLQHAAIVLPGWSRGHTARLDDAAGAVGENPIGGDEGGRRVARREANATAGFLALVQSAPRSSPGTLRRRCTDRRARPRGMPAGTRPWRRLPESGG